MAEQNAYQIADWNGQTGERWVANQARLDAMLAVLGPTLRPCAPRSTIMLKKICTTAPSGCLCPRRDHRVTDG
jgi:hypothetical protein